MWPPPIMCPRNSVSWYAHLHLAILRVKPLSLIFYNTVLRCSKWSCHESLKTAMSSRYAVVKSGIYVYTFQQNKFSMLVFPDLLLLFVRWRVGYARLHTGLVSTYRAIACDVIHMNCVSYGGHSPMETHPVFNARVSNSLAFHWNVYTRPFLL